MTAAVLLRHDYVQGEERDANALQRSDAFLEPTMTRTRRREVPMWRWRSGFMVVYGKSLCGSTARGGGGIREHPTTPSSLQLVTTPEVVEGKGTRSVSPTPNLGLRTRIAWLVRMPPRKSRRDVACSFASPLEPAARSLLRRVPSIWNGLIPFTWDKGGGPV